MSGVTSRVIRNGLGSSRASAASTARSAFARLLDYARRPFGLINYLGSCAGARIIPPRRMAPVLDHVIAALDKHLQRETGSALRRGMHYPTTWDPFFAGYMTLAAIYRYPTQHFRFHQRQLTLIPSRE